MSDFSDRILTEVPRKSRVRVRSFAIFLIPLAGILFQVYLPRFFQYLGYLEVPLLISLADVDRCL